MGPKVFFAQVGGKALEIKWSRRAQYRLGKLKTPPDLRDVFNAAGGSGLKFLAALCEFIWAAQTSHESRGGKADYATPEDLADALTPAEIPTLANTLADAYLDFHDAGEKKTDLTVTPHSSVSNSGSPSMSSSTPPTPS